MIKLTSGILKPIWLDPTNLQSITTNADGETEIDIGNQTYIVEEKPEVVAQMVVEFKIARRGKG